jgi:TetR/AcrR family transcriptional regulator, regulator of biofilm formation and stress response
MVRIAAIERRQALVEAAARVIAREGVAAASTRAITAEAGMSLASFHYVFPSRDALLAEVIERALEREIAAQEGLSGTHRSLEERVHAGFEASLRLLASAPGDELGMFELMQHALRTPGLEQLAYRQYERYWDVAERFVETTGVAWDRPPREIARVIVALNDGIALAWLATRDEQAASQLAAVATAAVCRMAVRRP